MVVMGWKRRGKGLYIRQDRCERPAVVRIQFILSDYIED